MKILNQKVIQNIEFWSEISVNLPIDLSGTDVCKTLESC